MTDDLISKQQAIVAIEQHRIAVLEGHKWDEGIEYGYAAAHRHLVDIIEQLPSIQPECKTGQWIIHLYEFGKDRYECDSCHKRCDTEYCYCPNCGRKMEGWKWG